jgi:hypothetical protein
VLLSFLHHDEDEEDNTEIFRIMFNTAFIPESNIIEASKLELSPKKIRQDEDKILKKNF